MWIGKPGDASLIPLLLLAYAIASVGAEFATVFKQCDDADIGAPEKIGRLSGTGWATGYAGGILSLILVLGFLAANPENRPHAARVHAAVRPRPRDASGDRITRALDRHLVHHLRDAMFLFTPDYPAKRPLREAVRHGLVELRQSLAQLPKQKSIATFLLANMIYTDGPGVAVRVRRHLCGRHLRLADHPDWHLRHQSWRSPVPLAPARRPARRPARTETRDRGQAC